MVFLLMAISISLIAYGYYQPATNAVVAVKQKARLKQPTSFEFAIKN